MGRNHSRNNPIASQWTQTHSDENWSPEKREKKTQESGPGTIRLSNKNGTDWSQKGTGISESGLDVISSLIKDLDQNFNNCSRYES